MPNTNRPRSVASRADPPWADVMEQGPKDSQPSGLMAGVARAEILASGRHRADEFGVSQTHVQAVGVDPHWNEGNGPRTFRRPPEIRHG